MTKDSMAETGVVNHCYVTENWIVTMLGGNIGYRADGDMGGGYAKILLETRDIICPAGSKRYYMTSGEAELLRDALTAALDRGLR